MSQEKLIKLPDTALPKKPDSKLFCGLDITAQSSDYSPRSMPWNSNDYLSNVGRTGILSSPERAEGLRPMLWNDLCSEYDAENFCKYLEQSGLELSPAFRSFEDPNYLRWIKLVTRDESIHFTNLTKLINQKHPDRIPEVSQLVSQFIEWDLEQGEYKGTFVLDHEGGDYFTPEFLRDCGRIINHALDPKKPKTPIPNIANV